MAEQKKTHTKQNKQQIRSAPTRQEFLKKKKPKRATKQPPKEIISKPHISENLKKPHISRFISRMSVISVLLVWISLSLLLFQENLQDNATFSSLKFAILQNPDGGGEHFQLGRYYERLNDLGNARYEYDLARSFGEPQADDAMARIRAKRQAANDIVAALRTWEAFVAVHPAYRDGHVQVASFYVQLGQKAPAIKALEQALAIDPMYTPAALLLRQLKTK